jgi:hypothetical protein
MFSRNRELWYALIAVVVVTAGYLLYTSATGLLPNASNLLGHGIGVLGFVFMLMTETLYTLRKRAKSARWGKVSSWLKFHIFTGLVGPYLVLLHPAMRFHGVAAVLSLLTGVVVLSGVAGRYIYTRTPQAVEVLKTRPTVETRPTMVPGAAAALQVSAARRALAIWRAVHVPLTFVLFIVAFVHIIGAIYYATLLH